jgi:hypothetical protein
MGLCNSPDLFQDKISCLLGDLEYVQEYIDDLLVVTKGWLEIQELTNKEANNPASLVEMTWLTCYPIPQILTYDRGTEFMAEFAKMIENKYGIKRKGNTVQNPQANAILVQVHQTTENIIRKFSKENMDEENP